MTQDKLLKDMVWVPGGAFLMGSDDFYPEEGPVHRVRVSGFWMDEHAVTAAEYCRFVSATGMSGSGPQTSSAPGTPAAHRRAASLATRTSRPNLAV